VPEDDDLERLAERAKHLHSLRAFASRPFVLEFAGSPKAGKTTSVEAMPTFSNAINSVRMFCANGPHSVRFR
jgi:hypothetical protein